MEGNVLVTGSSGTIGTRLCEKLMEEGVAFEGLDREENQWLPDVEERTQRIDLLNPEELEDLDGDFDTIVHLAANARVYELVEKPDLAKENIDTIYNILEYARTNDVNRLIFAGSREIYGDVGRGKRTEDEASVKECESPYTASKVSGEALVHAYRRCYGLDTTIVRYSNVYGMYDASDRVIPLFIKQVLNGEDLVVYGEEKSLDFTHINDAVEGTLKVLRNPGKANGDVFNIASGEATSLVKVAELIQDELGNDTDIKIEENRTGEIVHFTADITKARNKLGYEPEIDIEEGISRSVEWYTENLY